MKLALPLTLLLLVGFGVGMWLGWHDEGSTADSQETVDTRPVAERRSTTGTVSQPEAASSPSASRAWAQLEALATTADEVAWLQNRGLSDDVIRVMIIAATRQRFAVGQEAAWVAEIAGLDWWEDWPRMAESTREEQLALAAVRRELDALLGTSVRGDPMMRRARLLYAGRGWGVSDPAKIERLLEIEHDYREMARGLPAANTDAGRQAQEVLGREMRQDLAEVLSAEQLRVFAFRGQPGVRELMKELAGVDTTEEEFLHALELWRTIEGDYSGGQSQRREMTALMASPEFAAQLHDVLGEARWTEHLRRTDPEFEKWATFFDYHQPTGVSLHDVWSMRGDAERDLRALQDAGATDEEIQVYWRQVKSVWYGQFDAATAEVLVEARMAHWIERHLPEEERW